MVAAIILAAGRGSRMKSKLSKVLHKVGGKPLIGHTINQLQKIKIPQKVCVVGYQAERVKAALGKSCETVLQQPQLGTGHALLVALPQIKSIFSTILVMNADDAVFYKPQTIKNLISSHLKSKAKMTILTSLQKKASVSGRVVRDGKGKFLTIRAGSDASNEVVCGVYLFNRTWLEKNLPKIKRAVSGEYLLTDLIFLALRQNGLNDVKLPDPNEWRSVNTTSELLSARSLWRRIHD